MIGKSKYTSTFESGFVSAAHGPEEIQKTLEAVEQAFSAMG